MQYTLLLQDNKTTWLQQVDTLSQARTRGASCDYWAAFDDTGCIVEHKGQYDRDFNIDSYQRYIEQLNSTIETLNEEVESLELELCDAHKQTRSAERKLIVTEKQLENEINRWKPDLSINQTSYGLKRRVWLA